MSFGGFQKEYHVLADPARLRVLGGLKVGDRLVTDGALFLKHDIDHR